MSEFILKIELLDKIQTEFGTVKRNNRGYYQITTSKEGNHRKYFHRLIFKKFFGPIPEGHEVHHKDEDKTNNCLFNLQLKRKADHIRDHHTGSKRSEETREKMRKAKLKNYTRVKKQGFTSNGKQNYVLVNKDGKRIKQSIYKDKLQKEAEKLNGGDEI